jgi:electron transfer flavoprotein alpha subunit
MVASLYGIEQASAAIWVYMEERQGSLEDVSLELLARGRQLADQIGWPLAGLLAGDRVMGLAQTLIVYGADQVWLAEDALLRDFTIDAHAAAVFQAILAKKPAILLLGATPNGRDLAGRLAVRLRTGLTADCTGLCIKPDGVLECEVSGFGGGVLALIEIAGHRPQLATVRPGVFSMPEPNYGRQGAVERIPVSLHRDLIRARIIERVSGQDIDLRQAPVLVTGGRGVSGDFQMLRELADLLGGEVGATRPPVDEGLIERERQVGQTGTSCSPKVAICCGISGAFHFMVGIEKSGTVIAINSDPEAPIFESADYCVVGDVHQIVPALIAAMQEMAEVAHA